MNNLINQRPSEAGSAGGKFLAFLLGLALILHGGFQYIRAAYQAESLRTDMEAAVLQGLATPGKIDPVDVVKTKVQKAVLQYEIPPGSVVDVKMQNGLVIARVAYVKQVPILPFGIYNYNYKFDETITPGGKILGDNKK